MCTSTVAQHILNALAARIKNGSVFTAFDITTDARDATDENVKHCDSRNIVHQEFLAGEFPDNYNRDEFLELKNGQAAICYYPDDKTSGDHPMAMYPQAPPIGKIPAAIQQAQATTTIPVAPNVAPKAKQGGSVKDGNGFICTETSKGVINIPDKIVKNMTMTGGNYDIQLNAGGIMIYKAPDGHGRLRIASSKLGGPKVRLEVVANTITVEQA